MEISLWSSQGEPMRELTTSNTIGYYRQPGFEDCGWERSLPEVPLLKTTYS